MRLPRTSRISSSDLVTRSSPSNSIRPLTMRAAGGSTRMIVSASVLLPEPDFADDPQRLAGIDRERDVVHRAHDARASRRNVMGRELVEFEQRGTRHDQSCRS